MNSAADENKNISGENPLRVLLTTLNSKYIHTNPAIRLLYALNLDFKTLEFKEFVIKDSLDEIASYCTAYDVIAFSCYIWNITQTLAAARKIKSLQPSIKILLGGPEVSYGWQNLIAKEEIDFIIPGEGEIPFADFLHFYPHLENTAGIVSKKGSEVYFKENHKTFDTALLKNIRTYAYDTPAELQHKILYIESSRGCVYHCSFCLASLDNQVRNLPMQAAEEEILFAARNGRVIKFLDRTFNLNKERTLHIFDFIVKNQRPGNIFQFEITADIFHSSIIEYIESNVPAGLFRFEIGIQTLNEKANLSMKRRQDFSRIKTVIERLSNKIEMHLDLIAGLPYDTYNDFKNSFDEVFKLHAPELQLGFLKFLKGTTPRSDAELHGYKYDENPPYEIIESNHLSRSELSRIRSLELALEIYWNKKRALHSLKYICSKYSIFDFLTLLGEFFESRLDAHRYSLDDVYDTLWLFAEQTSADDAVLKQLIALDYYLQAKIRPRQRYHFEINRSEKFKLLKENLLDTHKFSYTVLETDNKILNTGYIENILFDTEHIVIKYDAIHPAEILQKV